MTNKYSSPEIAEEIVEMAQKHLTEHPFDTLEAYGEDTTGVSQWSFITRTKSIPIETSSLF